MGGGDWIEVQIIISMREENLDKVQLHPVYEVSQFLNGRINQSFSLYLVDCRYTKILKKRMNCNYWIESCKKVWLKFKTNRTFGIKGVGKLVEIPKKLQRLVRKWTSLVWSRDEVIRILGLEFCCTKQWTGTSGRITKNRNMDVLEENWEESPINQFFLGWMSRFFLWVKYDENRVMDSLP